MDTGRETSLIADVGTVVQPCRYQLPYSLRVAWSMTDAMEMTFRGMPLSSPTTFFFSSTFALLLLSLSLSLSPFVHPFLSLYLWFFPPSPFFAHALFVLFRFFSLPFPPFPILFLSLRWKLTRFVFWRRFGLFSREHWERRGFIIKVCRGREREREKKKRVCKLFYVYKSRIS